MAEQLDSFEFKQGRRGGSRYDRYLDGGIYRLRAGEDIPSIESGRTALFRVAHQKGLKVKTQVVDRDLVVQAYSKNGEALTP